MEAEQRESLRLVFWDRPGALANLALLGGLLGVPAALALAPRLGAPVAALGWLALAGLALGARVRLTVSADGYRLETLQAWIVPTRRRRYLLDWSAEPYQSFEADAPEGLCLTPPRGFGEAETDAFGPTGPELTRLLAQLQAEVSRLRAELPNTPRPVELPLHPELPDALEVTGRTFHPGSTRLASAKLSREASVHGARIPPGSTLHLNAEGFLDPRRPDLLAQITVAAPTVVPAPVPLEVPEGATLGIDPCTGRISHCSAAGAFDALGVRARGPARWNAQGQWLALELAEPITRGAFTLPPGTRLHRLVVTRLFDSFTAHLPAPQPHPELGALRVLQLDARLTQVTGASIDADVQLDGHVLRGGVMPVPLDERGRVDADACRKRELLS